MSRLFFALDLTSADKTLLNNFNNQQLNLPFKAVNKNNYHITLAFLGQVSSQQKAALIEIATQVTQQVFPITSTAMLINQIALFNKPKIIYLSNSYTADWHFLLAKELSNKAKSLNLFQENRPYRSHISIYRKANLLPKNLPAINLNITINSFSLYQSVSNDGEVAYQRIKTWHLTK